MPSTFGISTPASNLTDNPGYQNGNSVTRN